MKILLIVVAIIIAMIVVCRYCTFPLSAGSAASGYTAIENIRQVSTTGNVPLAAVIVEPRTDNIVEIARHFLNSLPANVPFQIYHGNKNKRLLYKEFKPEIMSGKLTLIDLGVDNLTVQAYSALLTSKEFWDTIPAEKVLVFQTDAITCGQSFSDLKEFIKYDFVGAPMTLLINILANVLFMGKGWYPGHCCFYNGGLSLRSKSKMLKVIEKYPWDRHTPEDIWFCAFLPKVGGKLPPKNIAKKFSYEADHDLDVIPWGLHKPRKNFGELCKICPESKKIPFVPSGNDYRNLYLL